MLHGSGHANGRFTGREGGKRSGFIGVLPAVRITLGLMKVKFHTKGALAV